MIHSILLAATLLTPWMEAREQVTCEAARLERAYSICSTQQMEAAENIVLPLDSFPDGAVSVSVSAKRAQLFLKEGAILANGVVIEKLEPTGSVTYRINAESCLVDRATKSGWAKGAVRISDAKSSFSGEDVYFSQEKSYVMSRAKSKLTVENTSSKDLMGKTQTSGPVTITSTRCDFDRDAGLVLFEGDAQVRHGSGFQMKADQLWVFFKGTNELDRIVCEGRVTFQHDARTGSCAWAEFRRASNEIELRGQDDSPARLTDSGVAEMTGRRILCWVDREQVEVEASDLTVLSGAKRWEENLIK